MNNLRPVQLSSIIGQTNVKKRLGIFIDACKSTNKPLLHTLFYGPPGTGKSTFAYAIANELGCSVDIGNASNITSIKAILPYLMRIKHKSILFIDEIHRLPIKVSEFLYTAMEDFRVDLGKETQMSIQLPQFTFIGATTNQGFIPKPLLDRFIVKLPLELYSTSELVTIISQSAVKLNMLLTDEAKNIIAVSSRNTPRLANNRLIWIKAYATSNKLVIINAQHVKDAMSLEGVNTNGMDANDTKYLNALMKYQPAGVNTISSAINIPKDTIEEVIEPFLLRLNLIKKTPRGRVLCQSTSH